MNTIPQGRFPLTEHSFLSSSGNALQIYCQHNSWQGDDMVLSFNERNGNWTVGSSRTLPSNLDDAYRINQAMDAGFTWLNNHLKRFRMIVAHGTDRLVGIGEKLPWHLPEDLAHFKAYTKDQPVIMGRATYESIIGYLGKPLPDRHTYVITRDKEYTTPFDNVTVVNDVEALLACVPDNSIVCGGASIYALLMPYINEICASVVQGTYCEKDNPDAVYLAEFRDHFILDDTRTQRNILSKKEITFDIEYWTR